MSFSIPPRLNPLSPKNSKTAEPASFTHRSSVAGCRRHEPQRKVLLLNRSAAAMPGLAHEASQINPKELESLSERYGRPLCRQYCLETDAYMRAYRGQKDPDRRGEVVFAIRQVNGEILLHTKHRYETPIYRLPTGGIERDELVEDALFREIAEETGQEVRLRRFLGVLDCNFVSNGSGIHFVSYIFYLDSLSEELSPTDTEEVSGYRTVPIDELCTVAQTLRALGLERRCWGFWRSLAHDLVYNALMGCAEL